MMDYKGITLDEKAQTSIEYVLLVAGVVLFVTITALILRGQLIVPLTNSTGSNASAIKNVIRNVS